MSNRFRDHRKIINTLSAKLEIITLKQFLPLIKRMELILGSSHGAFAIKKNLYGPCTMHTAPLLDIPLHASALLSLVSGSLPIVYESKGNLLQMVKEASHRSAMENGRPEYLVRIARRIWAVLAVEDFLIFQSDKGSALACLKPNQTQLVAVDSPPKKPKVLADNKNIIKINSTPLAFGKDASLSFDHNSDPYMFGSYKPEDMNREFPLDLGPFEYYFTDLLPPKTDFSKHSSYKKPINPKNKKIHDI